MAGDRALRCQKLRFTEPGFVMRSTNLFPRSNDTSEPLHPPWSTDCKPSWTDPNRSYNDHMAIQLELLLIEAVNLVRAVGERDFDEARFRCSQVGDIAWGDNNATLGNAALNLEAALVGAANDPTAVHEDLLAYLLAELDVVLKPLRDESH